MIEPSKKSSFTPKHFQSKGSVNNVEYQQALDRKNNIQENDKKSNLINNNKMPLEYENIKKYTLSPNRSSQKKAGNSEFQDNKRYEQVKSDEDLLSNLDKKTIINSINTLTPIVEFENHENLNKKTKVLEECDLLKNIVKLTVSGVNEVLKRTNTKSKNKDPKQNSIIKFNNSNVPTSTTKPTNTVNQYYGSIAVKKEKEKDKDKSVQKNNKPGAKMKDREKSSFVNYTTRKEIDIEGLSSKNDKEKAAITTLEKIDIETTNKAKQLKNNLQSSSNAKQLNNISTVVFKSSKEANTEKKDTPPNLNSNNNLVISKTPINEEALNYDVKRGVTTNTNVNFSSTFTAVFSGGLTNDFIQSKKNDGVIKPSLNLNNQEKLHSNANKQTKKVNKDSTEITTLTKLKKDSNIKKFNVEDLNNNQNILNSKKKADSGFNNTFTKGLHNLKRPITSNISNNLSINNSGSFKLDLPKTNSTLVEEEKEEKSKIIII